MTTCSESTSLLVLTKTEWYNSSDFIITKEKIKTLLGNRKMIVLNMLFLRDYHELPRIGLASHSLLEMHMKGLEIKNAANSKVPWILTHIYSKRDPNWVRQSFKKEDVVQFIFKLINNEQIEIEYAFKGVRSSAYRYPLAPLKLDAYLVTFTPGAHYSPTVKFMTEHELLEYLTKSNIKVTLQEKLRNLSEYKPPSPIFPHECKICYNSNIDRIFIPCGHCFCSSCCENMKNSGRKTCPLCSTKRDSIMMIKKAKECLLCPRSSTCVLSAVATPCGCLFSCNESIEFEKPIHCPNCERGIKKIYQAFF